MSSIKKILRPFYRPLTKRLRPTEHLTLIINFIKDFKLYRRYSTAFGIKDLKNKEAEFIIQYHRLEKGMLHENMKQAFARESILVLHQLMSDDDVIKSIARS